MDIIKRKSLFLFLKIRSLQNKIIMINKTCTPTKKIDRDRIGQTKTHKFRLRILHIEKKTIFWFGTSMQAKMTLCLTKAQMVMKEPMNQNKCLILDANRLL